MRQGNLFNRQLRRRAIALTIFCAVVVLQFLCTHVSSTAFEPQGRRRPQRRTPSGPTTQSPSKAPGRRDYSHFQHDENHLPPKAKCSDCHTIPSPTEPDVIAAATNPSAKEGYPYHDSCLKCHTHRKDFFMGVSPPICTVCHTRSSPRLTAQDLHKGAGGKQAIFKETSEFPGYFPHALHQRVIAQNRLGRDGGPIFVRAVFKPFGDNPQQGADNCTLCHQTDARPPTPINVAGDQAPFKPFAGGTFMTVPTGHAACFNCHWRSPEPLKNFPTKDDCAGCHLPRKKVEASPEAPWFKNWPKDWPKRVSLNFRHDSDSHRIGCTACHINIAQMETLNIQKAYVPIETCAVCHIRTPLQNSSTGEGVSQTIRSEMDERAKDSNYKCVGCHVSLIAKSEHIPCSHYLVVGEPCKQ